MAESSIKAGWSLILFVPLSLSLAHKHAEDVSTSLQGSSPNREINSLVPALRRSGYSHTCTCTPTHTGGSGGLLQWLQIRAVLNTVKHCSSRGRLLRRTSQTLKTRQCFKKKEMRGSGKTKSKELPCCEVNPQLMFAIWGTLLLK